MSAVSTVSRDSDQVAVCDRAAAADLVLNVAVAEAVAKLAAIRHLPVAYRVARVDGLLLPAVSSADRILGRGL